MKEKPLLFKEEMVRAILQPPLIRLPREVRGDGPFRSRRARAGKYTPELNRHGAASVKAGNGVMLGVKPDEFEWITRPKTQTRRVVNQLRGYGKVITDLRPTDETRSVWAFRHDGGHSYLSREALLESCPYGQPGDILWVRETWNALYPQVDDIPWYHHELSKTARELALKRGIQPIYIHRANPDDPNQPTPDDIEAGFKWQPSIFMPRAACRLTLRITSIHLERVQDISEGDAHAEGVSEKQFRTSVKVGGVGHNERIPLGYRGAFANLWEQINGPRGCGWHDNPWVFAIKFQRTDA